MRGILTRRKVFIDNQKIENVYDKAIVHRIARCTGHLRAVKNMVEDGRDCSEVLIQLSAVKAEIANTYKEILKQYMRGNLEEAVFTENIQKIKEINIALEKFI
jgi:DNA-binding FrmR family transcriptional regulator